MAKTAMLWARVEEEMVANLDAIVATNAGDRSDHIRKAIEEYIARQRAFAVFTDRLMAVANGETLNQA